MYTTQSVSLTQSTSKGQTKQYKIRLLDLRGHLNTPCDAYTRQFESHNSEILDTYDLLAKHQQSAVTTKEKKAITTSFSQHLHYTRKLSGTPLSLT